MRRVLITFSLLSLSLIVFPVQVVLADPPPVSSSVTASATIPYPTGDLRLTGYAPPNALVTFLRQGAVAGTGVASTSGYFDKTITGLNPGVQTFGFYATDSSGRTTVTLSFDTNTISGATITLGDFLLPPTISVDKSTLKRPDREASSGSAKPDSNVTAFFNSDPTSMQVRTDGSGNWQAKLDQVLHLGSHSTNALIQDGNGNQSLVSQTLPFTVVISADLNLDNKTNLTDFSILMFNYARADYPNKAADINDSSGPPDLVDFSVMMFYWTGG